MARTLKSGSISRRIVVMAVIGAAGVAGAHRQPPSNPSPGADRPAALLDGRAVAWSDLRDLLAETAGGAILEEVILDRLLEERCARAKITIGPEDLAAEERLLGESLDPDPQQAALVLESLRERRDMGTRRFGLFLRRNAMLRALVRDDVDVTPAMVQTEFDLAYGPRYQARIITTDRVEDALRAVERIRAGELFGEVAVETSTDSSAARGGLLEPISTADPRYPESIRRILASGLVAGELSPPISLEAGYAVVQMVRVIQEDAVKQTRLDDVRPEMERRARLAGEKFLMDTLAREAVRSAEVTILDPALSESWDRRRGEG